MSAESRRAILLAVTQHLGAHEPADAHLDNVIRRHIVAVLEACDDKMTLAAAVLNVHRRTLQRRLRQWNRNEPQKRRAR